MAMMSFNTKVVNIPGRLPEKSILLELPAENVEKARLFCFEMVNVGFDPELLNKMEAEAL